MKRRMNNEYECKEKILQCARAILSGNSFKGNTFLPCSRVLTLRTVGGPSPMMVKADTLTMCSVKGTSPLITWDSCSAGRSVICWFLVVPIGNPFIKRCLTSQLKLFLFTQWNLKLDFTLCINLLTCSFIWKADVQLIINMLNTL